MTRDRRMTWIALGGAGLLATLALAPLHQEAVARPQEGARITEVNQADGGGVTVLVELPDGAQARPGQTIEVRREGKPIGYGSVERVFSRVAVASIGTLVRGAAPLKAGDAVVLHDSGFTPQPLPGAEPVAPAPSGDEPHTQPAPPALKAKVVEVRDGVVLVDIGRGQGLEVGHELALKSNGIEVGRVVIELVGATSGGGLLTSGEAREGMDAVVVGRVSHETVDEGEIDFIALDFLGVVANLEHRTPHRAPCHIGVPIRKILPGSPARAAGLNRGDRIIAVGGIIVRDIAAVRDRITARTSDLVRVSFIRGDRLMHVDVDFSR